MQISKKDNNNIHKTVYKNTITNDKDNGKSKTTTITQNEVSKKNDNDGFIITKSIKTTITTSINHKKDNINKNNNIELEKPKELIKNYIFKNLLLSN